MQLKVAGAQLPVTEHVKRNLAEILKAIEFAAAEKADILLTPEGSLSGYVSRFDQQEVCRALEEIQIKARAAEVGLALGTCFVESDGRCYNQIRFYDRRGMFLGFHAKMLQCGTLDEPSQGEINDFASAPLRTFTFSGIIVGGLICNDLWANPQCTPMSDSHLTQQLSQMGAGIIFHAVNGGRGGDPEWGEVAWQYHDANLRMRARAGHLWIVTTDNCHPLGTPTSAPSGIVDPKGNWVVKVPRQGIHFFTYTISMSEDN